MSFNCQNCDSDRFDVYKGSYTCQYCGQAYRFVPGAGYVKCDPKEMLLLVSVVFKSGYRNSRRQTYDYIYDLEETPPTPSEPPVNEPPTPICGTPFINKEYTDYDDAEIVSKERTRFQRPKITPLTRYKETAEIVIFFGGLLLFWILTK